MALNFKLNRTAKTAQPTEIMAEMPDPTNLMVVDVATLPTIERTKSEMPKRNFAELLAFNAGVKVTRGR